MRILLIGSGGREHALAWALAASPLCDKLYVAPGNPGIAQEAECVAIAATDSDGIVAFAQREKIDFVVVGPEAPLVAGLVDRLKAAGIAGFGPSAAAAQLEASKGFTKDLCAAANIPTAAYRRFTDAEAAKIYARERGTPIVVKADGLAAGKGVTVATTPAEAQAAIDEALVQHRFGDAGAEIVVEEFLAGPEASLLALVDGTNVLPLASAQDHKRVGDGDTGPNTGGMGAISPAPGVTPGVERVAVDTILRPTVTAMAARGTPFKGVLYAGLILTQDGPKLIEFNVRFGDPECSGAAAAAQKRPLAGADRGARRRPQGFRSAVGRPAVGLGRVGSAGLSGRAEARRRHRRARPRRRRSAGADFPCRHAPRRRAYRRRWRTRAQCHRAGRQHGRGAAPRLRRN